MKKQLQQPSMDEWLLDPIHGLESGDEDNINQAITPTDFLTPEAFDYFSTIQPKRSTNNMDRQVRRLISRSIWPRILIARCRLLLSTATPLMINEHWDMVEQVLSFIRTALHYLGFFIHGLRLLMNLAHLMKAVPPLYANGFEHVLVFAPTGSGKTRSIGLPNLFHYPYLM